MCTLLLEVSRWIADMEESYLIKLVIVILSYIHKKDSWKFISRAEVQQLSIFQIHTNVIVSDWISAYEIQPLTALDLLYSYKFSVYNVLSDGRQTK